MATAAGAGSSAAAMSAEEAKLYDRQIRLWGVEAQRRMTASRVLVAGMDGMNAEVTKNLVLAGVNVTIQDTAKVSADDLSSQFFLDAASIGRNRAEASHARVKELNPRASVGCVTTSLDAQPDTFWGDFDVMLLTYGSSKLKTDIDALCRKKGIKLIVVRSFGLYSLVYTNFNQHEFVRTKPKDSTAADKVETIEFPTLPEVWKAAWAPLCKGRRPVAPPLYFALQAVEEFEASQTEPAASDDALKGQLKGIADTHGAADMVVDAALFRTVWACRDAEISPVCAVVGGLVGQEVVKAVSSKDEPVCNILVFDGSLGSATTFRVPHLSSKA